MKKRLRFRIDPVLPVVFDDALSYYEVLSKMAAAINELGDEIDEGLADFIKEAFPELIADATYDAETDTVTINLLEDPGTETVTTDPVSRLSINGISRPVVDAQARADISQETTQRAAASWLQGKNIVMYGDSTLKVAETYVTHMQQSGIPASIVNRGVSGETLTNQGVGYLRAAEDLGNFDYVFVCYGINDWSGISRARWKDAVKTAADLIIAAGSEPVFVFPWVVYIPALSSDGFINNFGVDMYAYVDAGIDVCAEYGLKYFNLSQIADVSKSNFRSKLTPSSNGYYLHESAALGQYIAKAILNGNYNTGKYASGRYNRAYKTLLPANWGYASYEEISALIPRAPYNHRKGRVLSVPSTRVCKFLELCTGSKCRISGYVASSVDTGYIDLYSIDGYGGAQAHICRVNHGSDFEFTFEPPTSGGCWSLGAQASTGQALIFDLSIAPEHGDARLTGYDPSDTSIAISYSSGIVVVDPAVINATPDGRVTLTSHSVRVGATATAGEDVTIGTIPFYPERNVYGTCRIGARTEHFRINATGTLIIHQLSADLAANTAVIFDGADVTPTEFFG